MKGQELAKPRQPKGGTDQKLDETVVGEAAAEYWGGDEGTRREMEFQVVIESIVDL